MAELSVTRWAICSTIKASAQNVLRFAAYQFDLKANRLNLDAPCPEAMAYLQAHPKIWIQDRSHELWPPRNRRRPAEQQPRQSVNAPHSLRNKTKEDWLVHIDVDEFLWAERPISQILAELPTGFQYARVRLIEALEPV